MYTLNILHTGLQAHSVSQCVIFKTVPVEHALRRVTCGIASFDDSCYRKRTLMNRNPTIDKMMATYKTTSSPLSATLCHGVGHTVND